MNMDEQGDRPAQTEMVNTLNNEVKKYATAIALALIAVGLFLYTIFDHWK